MNDRNPVVEALLYVRWPDARTEHLVRVGARNLRPGSRLSTLAGTVRVIAIEPDDRLPVLVHCDGEARRPGGQASVQG